MDTLFVPKISCCEATLSNEAPLVHNSAVYAEDRGAYRRPRIWRQLRTQGICVGKQRVQT